MDICNYQDIHPGSSERQNNFKFLSSFLFVFCLFWWSLMSKTGLVWEENLFESLQTSGSESGHLFGFNMTNFVRRMSKLNFQYLKRHQKHWYSVCLESPGPHLEVCGFIRHVLGSSCAGEHWVMTSCSHVLTSRKGNIRTLLDEFIGFFQGVFLKLI